MTLFELCKERHNQGLMNSLSPIVLPTGHCRPITIAPEPMSVYEVELIDYGNTLLFWFMGERIKYVAVLLNIAKDK